MGPSIVAAVNVAVVATRAPTVAVSTSPLTLADLNE